jgi:hypothetical protein
MVGRQVTKGSADHGIVSIQFCHCPGRELSTSKSCGESDA